MTLIKELRDGGEKVNFSNEQLRFEKFRSPQCSSGDSMYTHLLPHRNNYGKRAMLGKLNVLLATSLLLDKTILNHCSFLFIFDNKKIIGYSIVVNER